MNKYERFLSQNIKAWDQRTSIHISSDFYNLNKFKTTKSSLNLIELKALGNINNKSILHLQCHFGQDTLSLAHKGANVVGVDFSSEAIKCAENLSKEMNISAQFIHEDVLQLDINREFDIIFTSYGVLGWLPDLKSWAEVVAKHLKKGGVFFMAEFHPFISLLDQNNKWNYFYKSKPDTEEKYGSYTDGGSDVLIKDNWWNHSLSEIFESLELSGLKLLEFQEFDYSPYLLEGMIERETGKHVIKDRRNQLLPYVFTLKATKK
tara:strand:- start:312 stop:1100 length:789 start_codon:yes stop_codon:yes gene_type:complete